MRLLLIEDEILLGRVVVQGLELARYEVTWCQSGTEGYERACEGGWSAILLDLMLPGRDGWSICRGLRDRRDATPILMLTARDDIDDRVRGLELGADDYLVKPFAFPELRARIAALIRRGRGQRRRCIHVGELEIDTEVREVTRAGELLTLTPREYDLLEVLASREGHVVSKETILDLWGDWESTPNTVEVHLAALRRKLEPEKLIQTIHRRGYLLRDPKREAAGEVASS